MMKEKIANDFVLNEIWGWYDGPFEGFLTDTEAKHYYYLTSADHPDQVEVYFWIWSIETDLYLSIVNTFAEIEDIAWGTEGGKLWDNEIGKIMVALPEHEIYLDELLKIPTVPVKV